MKRERLKKKKELDTVVVRVPRLDLLRACFSYSSSRKVGQTDKFYYYNLLQLEL